jgi:hypothetical protein
MEFGLPLSDTLELKVERSLHARENLTAFVEDSTRALYSFRVTPRCFAFGMRRNFLGLRVAIA